MGKPQSRSYPKDPRGRAYYWLRCNEMFQPAVEQYREILRDRMARGIPIQAVDYAYFLNNE